MISPDTTPIEQLAETTGAFGEAARLALEASGTHNNLEIPHTLLRDEEGTYMGVLIAARSHLVADGNLRTNAPYVAGTEVIHEAEHPELTATAIMVGLWPYANRGNGEATFFEVQTTYTPEAERLSMPVGELAMKLYGLSAEATRAFDPDKHSRHGSGLIFARNKDPLRVFTTDKTRCEPVVVGRQELTDEVGIALTLKGEAQVWLGRPGLIRIEDDRIHTLDPAMRMAPIVLPEDGIRTHPSIVPASTTDYGPHFKREDQGQIVSVSRNDGARESKILNPSLPMHEVAGMLTEPIRWQEVTKTFLQQYDEQLAAAKLLSFATPNERFETLTADARARLSREQAAASRGAIAGSAVVAEMVRALPATPYNAVEARYFFQRH